MGSVDSSPGKCDSNKKELCYPVFNNTQTTYGCTQPKNEDPVVNYLVFDESVQNPKFNKKDPNDKYTHLNLKDASVVIGIQNFIRDEVMPRYSYDDYTKIPKGPIAILRPSVFMPDVLDKVRSAVNSFVYKNNTHAELVLEQLTNSRVQQLIQDTLMYLIANQKINIPFTDNLKPTIDTVITRLNLANVKNFTAPEWSLITNNLPPNLSNLSDPNSLLTHLVAVKTNSEKIDKPEKLADILTLSAKEEPYLDFFNFSGRPYSLLKLDILPGIYVDSDGELSVRPTPGVFLESIPKDLNSTNNRELIFIPGIFNSVSSPDCSVNSIFTPGIMSLPIDNYDLSNLPNDINKYLNKFVPMQMPFSINGFLTPLKASTSDTIATLIQMENNAVITSFNSHLLLTPLDFNPDTSFDIITKNDKFINNLFASESLNKVIREQKRLNTQNLASTLILSNPTMLPLNKQIFFNTNCINSANKPKYSSKGSQFYNHTNPFDNVTIVPLIIYDESGIPIPQSVVNTALEKFCRNYQGKYLFVQNDLLMVV